MNRQWEIYTLTDPRTLRARYVGVTHFPEKRVKHHLWDAQNKSGRSHKKHWLRILLGLGLEPIYLTIERGSGDSWAEREKFWISQHRRFCDLVNGTDGGEGSPGHVRSLEDRQRQSEFMKSRIVSDATKRKMSVNGFGRKQSQSAKEKISKANRGMKMSDETRAKMSATHKAMVIPPDQRAKMVANSLVSDAVNRGRRVRSISNGMVYRSLTKAGEAVGVCRSAIYLAIKHGRNCNGQRFEYVSGGEPCRG